MTDSPMRTRIPRSVWKTAWLGGMASWIDAGVLVASGTAFTLYMDRFGLTPWDLGALSALITGGLAVGALVGGSLGDRFGRKRVFSVDLAVLALGLALLTFAPSTPFLYAAAILTGLAMGADLPVSLALVAEETPERFRGRMIAFSQILWGLGTVLVIALSNIIAFTGLDPVLGGRILFGHLLVIAIVVWALRARLPESKEWEVTTGAVRVAGEGAEGAVTATGLRALAGFWPAVAALALFYAIGNIATNTAGQFTFYIVTEVAGASPQVATTALLGFIPVGLVTGILFMRFADTRARIPLFIVGGLLAVGGMVLIATTNLLLVPYLIGLFVATGGTGFAGEGLFKVWTQEKFPTASRATAQGIGIFFCRALAAVAALFTPALAAANIQGLYWGLAGLNAIALLIGLVWVRRLRDVRMLRDDDDDDDDEDLDEYIRTELHPARTTAPEGEK